MRVLPSPFVFRKSLAAPACSFKCDQGVNEGMPGPCPGNQSNKPAKAPSKPQEARKPDNAIQSPSSQIKRASQALNKLGGMSWDQLKHAGHKVGHVEHVAKEWVETTVGSNVEKLPPKWQSAVRGVWLALRIGGKVAFVTYTAGQKLAEEVAKQKGASPEDAAKLRALLSTIDIATLKPVQIGLSLAAGPAVAGAASFVPVGSLSYLAYSTAKDPLATLRAVRSSITGKKSISIEDARETAARFLDMISNASDSDLILAQVMVALDKTGNLPSALDLVGNAETGTKAFSSLGELSGGALLDPAEQEDCLTDGIKCREGVNAGKPGPCPGAKKPKATAEKPKPKPKPKEKPKPKPKPEKKPSVKKPAPKLKPAPKPKPEKKPAKKPITKPEPMNLEMRQAKAEKKIEQLKEFFEKPKEEAPVWPLSKTGEANFAFVEKMIKESPNISEEQKASLSKNMKLVYSRMPEKAHQRLKKGLSKIEFFQTSKQLGQKLYSIASEVQKRNFKAVYGLDMKEVEISGCYSEDSKSLYIDGFDAQESIGMGKKAKEESTQHVQAHELGHVLDGERFSKSNISDKQDWKDAFTEEIDRDDNPLTEYARVSRGEAVAEFSRLIYSGSFDLEEVKQRFPKCSKIFEKSGLWPADPSKEEKPTPGSFWTRLRSPFRRD